MSYTITVLTKFIIRPKLLPAQRNMNYRISKGSLEIIQWVFILFHGAFKVPQKGLKPTLKSGIGFFGTQNSLGP